MDAVNFIGPGPGISLPKRRACVNCTSAKAKCNRRAGEADCERCARLGKRCHFLDLPQKRRRHKGTRRIEGLESRLEELVTRVSTLDKDQSPISGSTLSTSGPPTVPLEPPTYTSRSSVDTFSSRARPSYVPPVSAAPPPSTSDGYVDLIERRIISPEYAEALLTNFTNYHAPFFPFVVLDNGVDVDSLRQHAPLIFLVVMSVSLRSDPSLQRLLGEEIQTQISTKLIGRGERSLQALQALLIYLAWHYYFTSPNEERDMFAKMQLCVAMVYDLNLEKGSSASLARKRALLGAYWLTAGFSRALRRPPVLQMSRYMEDCCRHLSAAGEHHTDKMIEPLVLLSSLAARVGETFSYFDVEYTSVRGNSGITMTIDGFLHELQLVKRLAAVTAADETRTDIIGMEIDYTESYILEVAVHNELWEVVPNRPPEPSINPSRTALLWHILNSNEEFVRKFVAIEDSAFRCLPYTLFWRMCYVLASLIRLTFTFVERNIVSVPATIEIIPGENRSRQAAQRTVDDIGLTQIIVNVTAKFESAAAHLSFAGGSMRANDNLAPFITKLKKLALAYSKKLRDAIVGMNNNITTMTANGIEAELMSDCPANACIQVTHQEQPARNVPAHGGDTQARLDDSGEGNFQMFEDWALLDQIPGLESFDEAWDSIMQQFKIPL